MSRPPFNQPAFFSGYNLPSDSLEQAGLNQSDLEDIYEDHLSRTETLESAANYVASRLRQVNEVHSIKIRIKHPEHLIEKIIRKQLEKPEFEVTPENYRQKITDLIGVRALHLFKEDWLRIHEFVAGTWKLHEKPIANVRKGDVDEYVKQFKERGCRINEHKYGYRSVHYLLESTPAKELFITELQVRTIFEEGWSEIDHRIRYPYDLGNSLLSQLSAIHNRLAGSADEIGSFIQILKRELKARDELIESAEQAREQAAAELETYLEKLQLTNHQKQELEKRVKSLTDEAKKWKRSYGFIDMEFLKDMERSLFKTFKVPKIPLQYFPPSEVITKSQSSLPVPKDDRKSSPSTSSNKPTKNTQHASKGTGVKQAKKNVPTGDEREGAQKRKDQNRSRDKKAGKK